ncbi:MAG TPA: hypothetical protein VMU73_00520 [Gaiellaceae bacterium]|nr:hypothetical protein [Gaiellaceae bacterium]
MTLCSYHLGSPVDHRGSGESPVDPALITVTAMVDDVFGILDALGVERCVIVPIEGSRALVELLPDAELVVFEGSGHVPTMTRPRDVVDATERRFADG